MAAVVGVFVVATALPAAAHTANTTGETVCANGDHLITWSIASADTPLPMMIVALSATLNGSQQFAVVGAAVGSSVPAEKSIAATTTVPGNLTGTIVLSVSGHWSDDHNADSSTSVSLSSACSPSTTSTTIETSTTEAPTSTTEAPTSTTIESSTTFEPTTTIAPTTTVSSTPIDTEGSTVQTTTTTPSGDVTAASTPSAARGALPFTGSSDSGPVIGLASLVAGAFALVFARRRHSTV